MRLFGYESSSSETLRELVEVSLELNLDEARRLSRFLAHCVQEMGADAEWEHEHLVDYDTRFSGLDVILVRAAD